MSRTILFAVTLLAGAARAGGFAVAEQGAGAMGMSNVAVARPQGPNAIYFNSAGLVGHKGWQATLSLTGILPSAEAACPKADPPVEGCPSDPEQSRIPEEVGLPFFALPALFASYGTETWAAGLGFFVPFGLGIAWDEDWRGRTDVTMINLRTFALQPTFAYRPSKLISFGGGLVLVGADVEYKRKINLVHAEGSAHLGGAAQTLGGHVGILVNPSEKLPLAIGLSWRSRLAMDFEGQVDLDVPKTFQPLLHDQKGGAPLTAPDLISLGVDYGVTEQLHLALQADYWLWSTFAAFKVDFEDPNTPDISARRDWNNALVLRLGGEYALKGMPLKLRAGTFYDQSPSPDETLSPSLPDASRSGGSLGVGYTLGPVEIDASYLLAIFQERESGWKAGEAFPAVYNASGNLFSVQVTWRK